MRDDEEYDSMYGHGVKKETVVGFAERRRRRVRGRWEELAIEPRRDPPWRSARIHLPSPPARPLKTKIIGLRYYLHGPPAWFQHAESLRGVGARSATGGGNSGA